MKIPALVNTLHYKHYPQNDKLAPQLPSEVTETSITSSSATVQWMLTEPYNPSRPEIFIVSYGGTSGQLNMSAPGVTANPTSQTYTTQLNSLQPGTEYFYRIMITNHFDSRFLFASFTTEDKSK
jgi:phosphodiesterase/alkaline phosphatase D-like protein